MAEKTKREARIKSAVPEEARQHYRTAREEMRKSFEALFPKGFLDHRRKARREILLAWRSMLDSAIQRMDEPD